MAELELIQQKEIDVIAIFTEPKGIDKILKGIEDKVTGIVPDTSTVKGRKEIASLAYKVAQSKTLLDSMGKDLVSDWKDKAKKVDESRKYARDFLDSLKDRVRQPLTEWEIAEEARIEAAKLAKKYEDDFDEAIRDNDLFNRMREIERREAELARIAAEAAAKEQARLEEEARKKAEAEAAERKKREETERIEREKRIAEEAKERAEREAQERIEKERIAAAEKLAAEKAAAERRAIEAEQKRIADIEAEKARAEQARLEAERKRLADIQAEKDRAEAEKRAILEAQAKKDREAAEELKKEQARIAAEKAAEEKRQKNLAHQKRINNEALQSLIGIDINMGDAKRIVGAIAKGKIANVFIQY